MIEQDVGHVGPCGRGRGLGGRGIWGRSLDRLEGGVLLPHLVELLVNGGDGAHHLREPETGGTGGVRGQAVGESAVHLLPWRRLGSLRWRGGRGEVRRRTAALLDAAGSLRLLLASPLARILAHLSPHEAEVAGVPVPPLPPGGWGGAPCLPPR